ncbi:MAG: hypothetical protein ACJAS7_000682 [Alpinimonas sp.]|jgi:hypothetical protein
MKQSPYCLAKLVFSRQAGWYLEVKAEMIGATLLLGHPLMKDSSRGY